MVANMSAGCISTRVVLYLSCKKGVHVARPAGCGRGHVGAVVQVGDIWAFDSDTCPLRNGLTDWLGSALEMELG